jgi:molybdopterin converting factor subunit 1
VRVTVLYFASARERSGTAREVFELPPGTVADVLAAACRQHDALRGLLPHLRTAVNQQFVGPDHPVPADAEVALIPPVAGGAGVFRVTDRPLSLDEVIQAVAGTAAGGVVTFTGQVRAETRGRRVVRLEYEAYAPMAERVLAGIGDEVGRLWQGARLAIVHRVGVLLPGDVAVVIAVGAPHRKEAFRACEHAIDRLKADAPIWKKEVYDDGQQWVGMGP